MRTLGTAILATVFAATTAFAAPLSSGKPAGVKKAQMSNHDTMFVIAGVGLAGLGLGLALSGDGNNPITPGTTTTTTTGTSS